MKTRHIAASALLLALTFSGCYIHNTEKYYARAVERAPYDAVIVPGFPFDGHRWDTLVKARVFWAYQLYQRGMARHLIFSGGAVYSPYKEGRVMALYALRLGLPDSAVLVEEHAEHSSENLYFGWKLAQASGYRKVAVATDKYQAKLLKVIARRLERKVGCQVDIIPMTDGWASDVAMWDPEIDPSSAHVDDFVSILERETFWERLREARGKQFDWDREVEELRALRIPVGGALGRRSDEGRQEGP
ncbi:MAG: YdcF family protein [Flavobacteriales bacterium]|nr:YdcF family protein [Flavobacteriales bacterium]MCB9166316.1 YdcF family protein [Flavobacteriales bacterium]